MGPNTLPLLHQQYMIVAGAKENAAHSGLAAQTEPPTRRAERGFRNGQTPASAEKPTSPWRQRTCEILWARGAVIAIAR